MREAARSYESVAWCYEEIARLYSLGRIPEARACEVEQMRAGDAALYVGVGCGEDALLAARCGVAVTGIDLSRAMLDRARRRLAAEGLQADLQQVDLFEFGRGEGLGDLGVGYDVVVANFVLNVFSPDRMRDALAHLVRLVRPGGRIMLADFAPPPASGFGRWLAAANYLPLSYAAWAIGLCALHPIYDYAGELTRLGLAVSPRRDFPLLPGTPPLYATWVATAPAQSVAPGG
jgi:ubiquinone/menaquinone biosynthesis C-methylase UbiE